MSIQIKSRYEPCTMKVLIVVTAGGQTNATPMFQIGEQLAKRGYRMEFATLSGQERFAEQVDWIQRVHTLGNGISEKTEETKYLEMTGWDTSKNIAPVIGAKEFLDSSWSEVYPSMRQMMLDPTRKPDFIFADYLVEAARDMLYEFGVPIAQLWPQMPTMMMPASYIPGYAGLQREVLTSEHATLWQRFNETMVPLHVLRELGGYKQRLKAIRAKQGTAIPMKMLSKPDNLCFVNSFWGIEAPKDCPPNCIPVGPLLPETYEGLEKHDKLTSFLNSHKRVMYISLGTHALLEDHSLRRLLEGAILAKSAGHIDGVIWSIRAMARKQIKADTPMTDVDGRASTVGSFVDNENPDFYFMLFAPQRAILDHPSVTIFFTHGGASSANEMAFHGKKGVAMGVYFDQLQNMLRLRDAGVAIPLDKNHFTPKQMAETIGIVAEDKDGKFDFNARRLQGIAKICARRKVLAADIIEEVIVNGSDYHLQPADVRMPWWKTHNIDMVAVMLGGSILTCVTLYLLGRLVVPRVL